jgi:hypothetical protein
VHGIEEVVEAVDVALDAQLPAVPGRDRVPRPQVLHLEPVFDIDGEYKISVHGARITIKDGTRHKVQGDGLTVHGARCTEKLTELWCTVLIFFAVHRVPCTVHLFFIFSPSPLSAWSAWLICPCIPR